MIKLPKRLYHGTSLSKLPTILKEGIKPRGRRKANDKEYSSSSKVVYLSQDGFAIKFACDAMKKGDTGIAVLEIDTDCLKPWEFSADDDIVVCVLEKNDMDRKKAIRTAQRRLKEYCPKRSLELSGSCAYHGIIPPSAITRVATVDWETQKWWLIGCSDVGTGPIAYHFTKDRHETRIKWLFDETPEKRQEGMDDEMWKKFRQTPETRDGISVKELSHETV